MVRNVACFITGGYTEAGYMQRFLEKINPNLTFHQKMPNKPRRKISRIEKAGGPGSESSLIKDEFSGITGNSLINKACQCLSLPSVQKEIEEGLIDAILVEDDTDDRFIGKSEDWINQDEGAKRNLLLQASHKDLPVVFLYASPEAEAWFISDWDNGFGWLYNSPDVVLQLNADERRYFATKLRRYILVNLLKNDMNSIEDYGFNENGVYEKLSNRLIKIVGIELKDQIRSDSKANKQYVHDIEASRDLYYSKKKHGSMMMKRIDPDVVAGRCRHYFARGYYGLKDLGEEDE